MHITEGILPAEWAAVWFVPAGVAVAAGVREIQKQVKERPVRKPFFALLGAAVFIISLLPIPVPVAGTSSHPCGTPLAAILVGPWISAVLAAVALFLQALFFAHGGLTTLGANIVAEGIVGSVLAFAVFALLRKAGLPLLAAGAAAGFLGDLAVYLTTSVEMALALHGSQPLPAAVLTIFLAYLPTQLPLAVLEGAFTGLVLRFVSERRPDLLLRLNVLKGEGVRA